MNTNDNSACFQNVISYRLYINFREAIRRHELTDFVKYMIDKLASIRINSNKNQTLLNCVMDYQSYDLLHRPKPKNWSEHLILYNETTNEQYENMCVRGHVDCKQNCGNIDYRVMNCFWVSPIPFRTNALSYEPYPIEFAIECVSIDVVKYMIEKGASLNLIRKNYIFVFIKCGPFSSITQKSKEYKMIDLLLQHSKQLYEPHYIKNDTQVGSSNVKYTQNVNEYDSYGYTALHYAIKSTNYNLIELIVHHKADVNLKCTHTHYVHARNDNSITLHRTEHILTTLDLCISRLNNSHWSSSSYCFANFTQFCIPTLKLLFDNGLKLEYDDGPHIQEIPILADFLKQKHISQIEPFLSEFNILPNVLYNMIFDYAW